MILISMEQRRGVGFFVLKNRRATKLYLVATEKKRRGVYSYELAGFNCTILFGELECSLCTMHVCKNFYQMPDVLLLMHAS